MKKQAREVLYFLFSQYLSDGLRITVGVLFPALIAAQFNQFEVGLSLSLGALCVSITDTPGPVQHKRNAMLLCNITIFLVAIITGFARLNPFILGAEILLFSFFFSMFMVYGPRAAALGTAGLVVMILTMDAALKPEQVVPHALLILGGGTWYMVLSWLLFQIRPYRQAQQTLGECIHEVARFLRLKAAFYQPRTNLEDAYQKLVAQQIVVSEKQDAVRELLFKSRQFMKEPTGQSRLLVLTFVDLVDLYEQITATHYDYGSLRERFAGTPVLKEISDLILLVADQLDAIGFSIQANIRYGRTQDLNPILEQLKTNIDALKDTGGSNLVLKKILVNLRNLNQRLHNIQEYYSEASAKKTFGSSPAEFSKFVSRQDYDLKLFRNNLTFSSNTFKHSFRVALVCLAGFLITKLFPYGHHSYWVLLTIIVILKPAFSLTKKRNYERIIGTLAGGGIGILILHFIQDRTAQFVFLLFFMVASYSFQRRNYVVSVIFMTPFVLILFNFLGAGSLNIVQERIIDTLIGCAIAFSASYFILPSWEADQLQKFLKETLEANTAYLQKLSDALTGRQVGTEEYKLARKQVYVSSANLSAAFQRMLSEPKRKQKNAKEIQKFIILNHILTSYVANLATALLQGRNHAPENQRTVKRALSNLQESMKKLGALPGNSPADTVTPEPAAALPAVTNPDENLLKEQLMFIQKVSTDIRRVTETIAA
ncbi:FUSC family membrane protein [Adhaeribacter soli]|uniref:Uncharacterized protein n=1 Tax=Adhaeribacter soli TaxID=2607655 RepID=A0A5N1J4D5_9BACT|nr:FUSC family membrane protein [Adhaeribacter soli]KAA9345544.1 hypothetical protein F0P94_00185 [Adhaeribacter soli]